MTTGVTMQEAPVWIHGDVHVKSLPKVPRFLGTRAQTFTLAAQDPNGPQLIRPRTRGEVHTIMTGMSSEDNPIVQSIQIPSPALGANLLYTLTAPIHIRSFTFNYTAGVATGNRFPPIFVLDNLGHQVAQLGFTSGIAPSTSCACWASLGLYFQELAQFSSFVPWPDLGILPNGYQLQVINQNAGDQISAVNLLGEASVASAAVWIAPSESDAARQKGFLFRSDAPGPIDLIGDTELWAYADPGSLATMYLSVFNEVEGSN